LLIDPDYHRTVPLPACRFRGLTLTDHPQAQGGEPRSRGPDAAAA
jgi:hypothetical protein